MMEFSSSSSSSSKKAKTPASNMSISVSCLVDGCNADLGQCREYHRRHKVCEVHSKTPKVTIGGREQRFCQQCSRFHSLPEFDEGKRSCRKRLDGHNRRRRKPQSDSISRTTGNFLSTQQGIARILSFSSPQIHLSSMVGSTRATSFKPENPIGPFTNQPPINYHTRHHSSLESSPTLAAHNGGGGGGNHFNFFQHRSPPPPPLAVSSNHAGNSRALSLLSLPPPPPHQIPATMPPISQYGFAQEMHNEGILSGSSGTTLQFQGMFHDDQGDSSSSGIKQQTLSFRWG